MNTTNQTKCCCKKASPNKAIIAQTTAKLSYKDNFGAIKARLGINRYKYTMPTGLYKIGSPDSLSPVFVSANYKLSFDALRKELSGIDSWILVINTQGINVWCAAGKGTFSAEEINNQIELTKLHDHIDHNKLIIPQLSAPGVNANLLKKLSGFRVIFGPVIAKDIPDFLKNNLKATPKMRKVTFPFIERVKLIPIEVNYAFKFAIPLTLILLAIILLTKGLSNIQYILWMILPIIGAFLIGSVIVPALLPFIPLRSFVLKGALAGIVFAAILIFVNPINLWLNMSYFTLLPAISAFFAFNFTGTSTFTSQNGVNKEIKLFAKPMALAGITGLICTIIGIII